MHILSDQHTSISSLGKQPVSPSPGCGSFFCKGQEDGRMGKKTRRGRDESQEEQTGTQCPHASLVSAGLQDVLGMTQWRKEHPKATWQEIEAAVDERINQMRSQLIEYIMQMSDSEYWRQK